VICLAEGDPAAAPAAVQGVLDGAAPVIGYVTVVEAQLLAGLAHRELGDQRAANHAAECALALAEPDRLVLPFVMTGSAGLLEALPRHQTAHAALLTDILDTGRGSPVTPEEHPAPLAQELSPSELRVLRYLPTNLSRPEIAGELSVSLNTVGTHLRRIYAKLGADDRSAAVHRARELRLLSASRTQQHSPAGLQPRFGSSLLPSRNCRITPDERGPPRLVPLSPRHVPGTACSSGPVGRGGAGRRR